MRTTFVFLILIFCGNSLLAQTKTFEGAWFDISYPSSFAAIGSLESISGSGFESAVFRSPDNLVEFYIFSPQWSGEPSDILIQSNEILENSSSEFSEDIEIRRWTIESRDGTYKRSYQEKINSMQNTNWIVGIKYADLAAFEKYKINYILFKSSLKQYAD